MSHHQYSVSDGQTDEDRVNYDDVQQWRRAERVL